MTRDASARPHRFTAATNDAFHEPSVLLGAKRTTLLTQVSASECSLRWTYRIIYRLYSDPAHIGVAAVEPHITAVSQGFRSS